MVPAAASAIDKVFPDVSYYVARECSETYLWPCKGAWIEGRSLYEGVRIFRQNASGVYVW